MAETRARILARRAKLVAAALAASTAAAQCGGSTTPQACLSIAADSGPSDAAGDADGGPQVCLSAPFDSGPDTQADDGASDAPKDG
jgi:hypothetical protein